MALASWSGGEPSSKRPRIEGTNPSNEAWLAPLLAGGFSMGASALGFAPLAPLAGLLGYGIGKTVKQITGYGDYKVNRNSLLHGNIPQVSNPPLGPNSTCIQYKEYLGDVISSVTAGKFAISKYVLNPSNAQLWEFLAQIACNYEEWRPEGICFIFRSTSADALNSVNTALGTVIMATNYNPYNPDFTTKGEMEAYEFCTAGVPSQDLIHMVECDPHQGAISLFFTNTPQNQGNGDIRFNQLGTFYIATVGCQGTSVNLGELWVTYQISLLKPKLFQSLGLANDMIYIAGIAHDPVATGVIGPVGGTSYSKGTIPFSGWTASEKMYLSQSGSAARVYFPVYAYTTTYMMIIAVTLASGITTGAWTLAVSPGNYPAAYTPVLGAQSFAPQTGLASSTYMAITFYVTVPGGFICNDFTTPSVAMSNAWGGVNITTQIWISQIPNSGASGTF